MTLDQALENLKQVCMEYRGTLQEHQALQQSLSIVEKECSRIDPPEDMEETED